MSERMTLSHATHATQCDGAPHRRPVPGGLPGIRSWPEVDLGPTDSTRDLLSNFIALVTRQQAPLFGCTLGHSPRLSQVSGRPLAKMGCRLGLSFLAQRDRLGMFIGGRRSFATGRSKRSPSNGSGLQITTKVDETTPSPARPRLLEKALSPTIPTSSLNMREQILLITKAGSFCTVRTDVGRPPAR